jgi:predicted AlkP superfamily pyrophosphatase or phosphodiesterase
MKTHPLVRFTVSWAALSAIACASAQQPAAHSVPASAAPVASVATSAAEPAGPVRHVVVMTIDGLMPDAYLHPDDHGLRVPNLRRLVREGASSDGALSVFPTLTYPAHTSIASGVLPAHHGIVTNSAFDPLEQGQNPWRWYDSDVKVPRLWDVARAAGYRTAVLDWPVTVGETATFHVPEFWRAKVPDDVKLIDALSTPGLLQSVGEAYPDFRAGFRPQDVSDEAGMDLAEWIIRTSQPHVLFLHIWQVDAAQHKYGIDSAEAKAAIETADTQVGRLLNALQQAGIAQQTVVAVASDHGFASVTRCVNPSYLLAAAQLLHLDERGRIASWDAAALPAHGVAYVYVNRPGDARLEAATKQVFLEAQARGNSGISRILDRAEIAQVGGDPSAFIALEAEAGTYFGTGREQYETVPAYLATHGYAPTQPQMKASLLLFGATVTPGKIVDARLIDIAPTLAGMLGLSLGATDGKQLTIGSGVTWHKAPAVSDR